MTTVRKMSRYIQRHQHTRIGMHEPPTRRLFCAYWFIPFFPALLIMYDDDGQYVADGYLKRGWCVRFVDVIKPSRYVTCGLLVAAY